MLKHTSVYINHFNIVRGEHHFCEICGKPATGGIHHLEKRGEGKDIPGLLMALCMEHHTMCEDKKVCNQYAKEVHARFILCNPYQHPEKFSERTFLTQKLKMELLYKDS